MAKSKEIIIKGAREHNLNNINLKIPREKFIVITGVSGSGKSSLAFDTIYAEGQRRYVESLSTYARQFLGRMEKPDQGNPGRMKRSALSFSKYKIWEKLDNIHQKVLIFTGSQDVMHEIGRAHV